MIGLNPRQRAFVAHYAGNATEAARAAGYQGSDNALAVTAHRLMKNPKVRAALQGRAKAAGTPSQASKATKSTARAPKSPPSGQIEAANGQIEAESGSDAADSLPAGVLTLGERLLVLSEIAGADTVEPKDRIRAVEVLTKLIGDGAVAGGGSATATATAQVLVWVGNGRGPAPEQGGG